MNEANGIPVQMRVDLGKSRGVDRIFNLDQTPGKMVILVQAMVRHERMRERDWGGKWIKNGL